MEGFGGRSDVILNSAKAELFFDRESLLGRLVRRKNEPRSVFIITGVSYEVGVGKVAFLRRIRPAPVCDAGTVALGNLEETRVEDLLSFHDGLTSLVARALHGTLESEGSIFAVRTKFREYQFRPLIKYLGSSLKRILIADEVGLGKTIEAGYILVEELARAKLSRILVLCPAGLRRKWQDELRFKFGMEFGLASGRQLQEMLSSDRPFRTIASFDSLRGKTEHVLSGLLHPLDLLIIDEAHHMIGREGDILRRKLGLALSRCSRRVIGLSATPIQIDRHDLRRVLEVILGVEINPDRFERDIELASAINRIIKLSRSPPPLRSKEQLLSSIGMLRILGVNGIAELDEVVGHLDDPAESRVRYVNALRNRLEQLNPFKDMLIRNRKRDVGELRTRIVVNHPVQLQTALETGYQHNQRVAVSEQSIYDEVDSLLKASFTHVHRLQLSSCLYAMIDLLRSGMRGFSVWHKERRFLGHLDLQDVDDEDQYEREDITLSEEDREKCRRLVDKYGLLSMDSKWNQLVEILSQIREHSDDKPRKVILFTQWVPTLRYLSKRSNQIEGYLTYGISGEESQWHIQETLEAFREAKRPAILFATDFLSEGRDLQEASAIINFDFPYNPQRVEQRIGRIDRVGQEAKTIEIHNIWVKGSLDEQILDILQNRLNIFEESLGDVNNFIKIETREDGSLLNAYRDESRLAALKELDNFGVFLGVEDFLDKEIRVLRMKRAGNVNRFIWLIVARALVLASGGLARVEEFDESLLVGPISDDDLEIACRWGLADAHFVRLEIESNRDQRGFVRIAKHAGAEGLFVPSSHPLARLSVNVVFNSSLPHRCREKPIVLSENPVTTGWKRRVILCSYLLEDDQTRAQKLTYWMEEAEGRVRRIQDRELEAFQGWLEHANLTTIFENRWKLSRVLSRIISMDFAEWSEQQRRVGQLERPATEAKRKRKTKQDSDKSLDYLGVVNLQS